MSDSEQAPEWYRRSAGETAKAQAVVPEQGLSQTEVAQRQAQFGPNEITAQGGRSLAAMLLGQFSDFMILVLVAAAVISGVVGEPQDAIAIVVIVVLNAVIGFIQEYRAERAVAALRRMAAPTARVRRDGVLQPLPATALVPGDVVLLEAGNVVPADLRLIESAELRLDESALTGESQPVGKQVEALQGEATALGDRHNMAHKGTLVTAGRGVGIAVATGMASELGRIATLIAGAEDLKTPLQKRLARFGRFLTYGILAICAIIFAVGLLHGVGVVQMFLTAVSLAVAAVPEALPAVVTISLALGARKMIRRHTLIRRLPAVETLGSVTYICSDKTGTLTENRMVAEQLVAAGERRSTLPGAAAGEPWDSLALALALNNDVAPGKGGEVVGDPTEVALYRAAADAGYVREALEQQRPRIAELPFDSERKCMSTLHREGDVVVVFTKGAVEAILPACRNALGADGELPLQPEAVAAEAERLAGEGYRVLAFAFRRLEQLPAEVTVEGVEQGLTFIGLAALVDPPRAEARAAVDTCRDAGITPVMITGDHPATALAMAGRVGIVSEGGVLTGPELVAMDEATLAERAKRVRVYARVSPEQKIAIVRALQRDGEFVAMTGDGVNDAPALKQADIGVAMGQKGTDVAREAADMVLLDDNFATIVTSVREGRRIFDNIRKFIKDTMSSNSGEIWTLFLAPFMGLPVPLLPIHILWINLVTDGLPGLAFTQEPAERGIMQRPPRPPRESLFAHGMWQHIIWVGLFVGGLSIASQAWAISRGLAYWQTITFTVLTVSQLFHSMAVRSERDSLFTIGLLSNPYMLGAVLLTVILQLMVIYVPALNAIFRTQPLPLLDLAVCFGLSSLVLVAVELEKWMVRRGWIYAENGVPADVSAPR